MTKHLNLLFTTLRAHYHLSSYEQQLIDHYTYSADLKQGASCYGRTEQQAGSTLLILVLSGVSSPVPVGKSPICSPIRANSSPLLLFLMAARRKMKWWQKKIRKHFLSPISICRRFEKPASILTIYIVIFISTTAAPYSIGYALCSRNQQLTD